LSEERKAQYFVRTRDGYQVTRALREYIVLRLRIIISDAPFTQMDFGDMPEYVDLPSAARTKEGAIALSFRAKAGGALFLGPSESPGELSDEFQVLDSRWRLYSKRRDVRLPVGTRVPVGRRSERMPYLSMPNVPVASSRANNDLIAIYDELLATKMGPSILVSSTGEIVHVFGGAERYLRLKAAVRRTYPGVDSRGYTVRGIGAIHHVLNQKQGVRHASVPFIEGNRSSICRSRLSRWFGGNRDEECAHCDRAERAAADAAEGSTGCGGRRTRSCGIAGNGVKVLAGEPASNDRGMETSNEELQAANEELIASNEELQSTNEELHSVNEELYTVNAEHQRRVEELAEANDDMDNLLATTRVGVIFLDDELYIRRFTPEIARVFRLDQQDMGRSIERFAHHLNGEDLIDRLKEVVALQVEKEFKVKDRRGTPFLLRILPYRSGDTVDGVVLTLIDITSLRSAEMELERFKFMTESATDSIFLTRRDGSFVYVNPAMCKALGYEREELMEQNLVAIHRDFNAERFSSLFKSVTTQQLKPYTAQWRHRNGHTYPVEATVSSLDIDGERFVCGNVRDISERLATEREMQLQHLAIESAVNGIVITDPRQADNPITYANPGFLELTGYSRDEVVGKNCRFLQGVKTDRQQTRRIREALRDGQPVRVSILNYRKDGSSFWNDLQITPVFDDRGLLINFVGVQHDITEQVRTQQALERANRSANRANEAKSSFLATMSHELRTPLTAVLGFADMLRGESNQPEYIEKIDTIKRNGQYLLALLNDILDLSKIEAGKLDIEREVIDIYTVIRDVESLMQVRAMEAGIPLRFEFVSDLPTEVTADEVRVRQNPCQFD
jgi:two-component system, chemotaxis family, CheB/CheR fusion protein